jgi:hypothetical protein
MRHWSALKCLGDTAYKAVSSTSEFLSSKNLQAMSSARKASLKALEEWIANSKSRALTIAKGEGIPGHRTAPSQTTTNDAKIGSRLDNAEVFQKDGKKFKRFKWQLNKNAENSTLRKLAAKNSHKVWSYADIEIDENADRQKAKYAVNDLFSQLEQNMEDE